MGKTAMFLKEKFPPFLIVLVLLYLWERYSYYCNRSILSLYMTEPDQMGLEDSYAYGISALFNAIGYVIPVLAGFLADRYFGFQIVMITGAVILTSGHLIMILAIFSNFFFFWGIACISLGTGLFKGIITSLLGACYDTIPHVDRTSGFTLFYTAVNVGSLLASISSGYIATYVSYHLAFGLAGFYMLIGITIYLWNKHIYDDKDVIKRPDLVEKRFFKYFSWQQLLIGIFYLFSFVVSLLYYYAEFMERLRLIVWVAVLVAAILVYYGLKTKGERERKNYYILMIYFFYLFVFTAIELQLNTLFMLFIQRNVYQYVGALHVPPPVATSVNPFAIVVIGLLLSFFYTHKIKYDIPRIGIAIFLNSVCFFILYWGCLNANPETGLTSYAYPLVGIFLMAVGEIFLAPLMSSSTTRFSPKGIKGVMIGMYLSIQGAASLTEYLFGQLFSVPVDENGNYDVFESLEIYKSGFLQIGLYNLIPFGLLFVFYPIVARLHRDNPKKVQNISPTQEPPIMT